MGLLFPLQKGFIFNLTSINYNIWIAGFQVAWK